MLNVFMLVLLITKYRFLVKAKRQWISSCIIIICPYAVFMHELVHCIVKGCIQVLTGEENTVLTLMNYLTINWHRYPKTCFPPKNSNPPDNLDFPKHKKNFAFLSIRSLLLVSNCSFSCSSCKNLRFFYNQFNNKKARRLTAQLSPCIIKL